MVDSLDLNKKTILTLILLFVIVFVFLITLVETQFTIRGKLYSISSLHF